MPHSVAKNVLKIKVIASKEECAYISLSGRGLISVEPEHLGMTNGMQV